MRKKNMRVVTLTLLPLLLSLLTGLVKAPPFPIGAPDYKQANPFDSRPTAGSSSGVGTPTGVIENVFDGDLDSYFAFQYGASASGTVEVHNFKKPSDNGLIDFTITYIDIKISYKAASTPATDDQYRFVTKIGASTTILMDWVTGNNAKYDQGNGAQGHRTFSNVAKPGGGAWTWADITSLRVDCETHVVGTNNFQKATLYEVWVTAYSTQYPATNTISVQPSAVTGLHAGDVFYIDIYVTNVTNMWGYQINLHFNPDVLMALEYMSYGPFVQANPSEINNTAGYVVVCYNTFMGDSTGFTGNTPITRIYFQVVADGTSMFIFNTNAPATVALSVLGDPMALTPVNGYFSTTPIPTRGAISGKVRDYYGQPISDATVTAVGPETKSTTTVGDGIYVLFDVAVGTYSVTASKTGFFDQTQPATVTGGEETTLNFLLTRIIPTTGTICGAVRDASHLPFWDYLPISDATVTAVGPETKSATTTADGWYSLPELIAGNYTVTASKTGFFDQTQPATVTGGGYTYLYFYLNREIRDVAVTHVELSPTTVTAGDPVTIYAIVENQGDVNETFTVTIFYDRDHALPPQAITDLPPKTTNTLTFTWDTTGVPVGTYLIKAQADIVPGETDTGDNTFFDGIVEVSYQIPSVELSGEFDYLQREPVRIKIVATVRDAATSEPISNANVNIKIYDGAGGLWISSIMTEKLVGTGVYEWTSSGTIAKLGLKKGVYLANVKASVGNGPERSDTLLFHIDPPAEETNELPYYLAFTAIASAAATSLVLKRRQIISSLRQHN